jgi:hypothetical protein
MSATEDTDFKIAYTYVFKPLTYKTSRISTLELGDHFSIKDIEVLAITIIIIIKLIQIVDYLLILHPIYII